MHPRNERRRWTVNCSNESLHRQNFATHQLPEIDSLTDYHSERCVIFKIWTKDQKSHLQGNYLLSWHNHKIFCELQQSFDGVEARKIDKLAEMSGHCVRKIVSLQHDEPHTVTGIQKAVTENGGHWNNRLMPFLKKHTRIRCHHLTRTVIHRERSVPPKENQPVTHVHNPMCINLLSSKAIWSIRCRINKCWWCSSVFHSLIATSSHPSS